ncbi:hypothetical protein UFOVP622_28 [uncultured Caudovirales phage]|uniref:Portal protein n=1 Tax=uncultured Caudovirales phage TaxID=2100421 RepID=A0A6J5N3T9_9CAUD|nr:hypothetical protein UFOVP622_28 [uncultured Caudovirales phage]
MNKQTQIIELSQYTTPVITEQRNEGWVDFGKKNDYYQFLIDRFQNSATNNAVINNICKLIYGRGITALDASKKPTDYANFLSLVSSDDIKRIISDTKMLGQSAIQVHYNKDRSVKKFLHLPVNLIRSEKCNEDGEILGYYYSDNWQKTREYKPIRYDAFGTSKSEVEILMIQPYSAGMKYYSYVDYQGALDYCMLEEKVSEYLINEVSNSFAPTTIINFNNGQATPEQKRQISEDVTNKLTGSTGKKVIISFNDNPEAKTTIDTIQLQKAADQYQYLSDESRNKILVGHNVTSPLLFGIATSTGFSSNADELKNSAILFDNMVIRPFQELVIEAFDKILAVNNISLKLYFKKLNILDADGEITNQQPIVEETKLSSELSELELYLNEIGEDFDNENWVIVDERDVDYEDEINLDAQIDALNNPKKNLLQKLASAVKSIPNAKSEQDATIKGVNYKVRYQYTGNSSPKREFCNTMLSANKYYRKEDLERANSNIVNPGFGHNGEPYNIFLFKGGPRCKHSFKRVTFASTKGIDVNSPNAPRIGTETASKRGFKVTNPYQVSVQPNNLPRKGFHPNNENLPSDVQ